MGIPASAIEIAALARLRGDTTLQGLMTSATASPWSIFPFGSVPINQAFPYIACGVPVNQVGTADVMALAGVDSELQISVLTQTGATGGFHTAWQIANRVNALFDRQALDISASGFSNFFLKFQSAPEMPQDDGLTQHIPMRFRLMTQG